MLLKIIFCFVFSLFSLLAEAQDLRVALRRLPKILDPVMVVDNHSQFVMTQMHETLYSYGTDNLLSPRLVLSHAISQNGLTVKIKLRADATFWDGSAVSANDVEFSIRRAVGILGSELEWALGSIEGFGEAIVLKKNGEKTPKISGIKVINNLELEIHLKQRFSHLFKVLSATYFAVVRVLPDGSIIGAGTYRPISFAPPKLILQKISKLSTGPTKVEFTQLNDDDYAALFSKDKLDEKPFDLVDLYQASSDTHPGFLEQTYSYLAPTVIFFNTEVMKNSSLRCSLSTGVFSALEKYGYSLNPLEQTLPYGWNLLPEKNLTTQKAQIKHQKNEEIEVLYTISGGAGLSNDAIQYASNILAQSGLKVNFSKIPPSAFYDRVIKGKYKAAIMGYAPDYLDPDAYLYPFVKTGQQYNWMKYSNPTIDLLLNLSRKISDEASRVEVFHEVFSILKKECPVVFLGTKPARILIRDGWIMPGMSAIGIQTLRLEKLERKAHK